MTNAPLTIRLESSWLDAVAATYPEEIREDFIWLGSYLRDRCSRNVDVLEAQLKKLGIETTAGTLSRIVRGKMFDEDNTPIMRVKTFHRLVEVLRRDERLSLMAGKVGFIDTPTSTLIHDYIDIRRAPETVCKFGLIVGATGSQKTASCKEYILRNNHGTCVHLESPDTPSLRKFHTDLAERFGISIWATSENKRLKILENVNDRKTIIIDNIQRLYKPRQGWNQPVFNFLQKLQDDTGCTIILLAVPEFEMSLRAGMDKGYFEQFEGRCGGADEFLVLPEWPTREDVLAIAEAFKLQDAEQHADELEKLGHARGRIRILFNALQKAKRLAESTKRPLTIKHVRSVTGKEDE
ncbi:MAG: AAA family ATPase [Limisphaerales bacterium]